MADSTLWWLLAGVVVAVELLTGTFYLLMLAVGMVAGALAAHAGGTPASELLAAALVGGGAVTAWHVVRKHRLASGTPGANMDFDAGEQVQVDAWTTQNTASVRYRGTVWTAVPAGGAPEGTGLHRVRQVDGSRLVLEKI